MVVRLGSPEPQPVCRVRFSCCAPLVFYPRPTNGILLAITVMNSTLASSGRPAI
jgi:hypothetical protein